MRTLLVLVASVVAVVAAPVPKAVKKPDDAASLEGRWECVTLDSGSGPDGGPSSRAYWFSIRDGKLSTGTGNTKGYDGVAFTLDPAQCPKHFDITQNGSALPCIYELTEDTLTWCHPQDRQPRPTEFKGGDGRYCFVFKRAKKE